MKNVMSGLVAVAMAAGIVFSAVQLYANSATSGNPLTVNRNSGINALRNPALMSWQKRDSLGIAYIHVLQAYSVFDGNFDISSADWEKFDVDIDDIYNGSLLLSYVKRDKRHSFGIGISNNNGAHLSIDETKSSMSYYVTGNQYGMESTEKGKSINTSGVFSYAYRFGNRQSAGLQVETGYSEKSSDKHESSYMNWILQKQVDSEMRIERITGAMSLGFFYSGSFVETGLMIKGGEFAWESSEFSYGQTIAPNSGSLEMGPDLIQTRGYGIVAGAGYRYNTRLLLNVEAGVELPFSYNKKVAGESFILVENDYDISAAYVARLGADYALTRNLCTGIGVGYRMNGSKEENKTEYKTTKAETHAFEFTTGIEYGYSEDLKLILTCDIMYLIMKNSLERTSPAMNIDMNFKMLYTNIIAGITIYF